MNHQSKIAKVEYGRKQRVEEEAWKQKLAKFYVVAKNTDFDFTHQNIMATDFLLFNQTQLPQLLKMVKSYAGAAKVQSTLNLTYTNRLTVF